MTQQHEAVTECDGMHGADCPAGILAPGPACSERERQANMHIPDETH